MPAQQTQAARPTSVGPSPPLIGADTGSPELRIMAGSALPRYVDRYEKVWLGDRYFKGGEPLVASPTPLLRAEDSFLFKLARQGDFQYDIRLKPGVYELHLHFVEMQFGIEP